MLTHALLNAARLALAALTTIASGSALAGPDIKDCRPGESLEMAQTIDWAAQHWKEFETEIERTTDVNIKNCLENRFKKNGRVVCEKDMGGRCSSRKGNANAWASPFNKRSHMCPDFMEMVRAKEGAANKNNRKACYLAILHHEFAHTCERTHKSIEKLDNAAFDFYKSRNPDVTITLADCEMD